MIRADVQSASSMPMQEQAGIIIDKQGAPTGTALTFPAPAPILASAAMYVLAACADGVHVYDRTTADWVQSLAYPGGLKAAPGQHLAVAQNVKGSCILVAGYRKVRGLKFHTLHQQGSGVVFSP